MTHRLAPPARGRQTRAMITIRKFHHNDLDDVYAIYLAAVREGAARFYSEAQRQAWAPNDHPHPEWRDRLGDAVCYVASEDDMLLGFASITHDGHLDFLYVAPAQMGRGISKRVYDAAISDPALSNVTSFDVQASEYSRRFLLNQGWTDAPKETVERFDQKLPVYRMRFTRT